MSDMLSPLFHGSIIPSPEASGTDELLRAVGGGYNSNQDGTVSSLGNSQDFRLPRISSLRIEDKLAAYQTQDQSTKSLADHLFRTGTQKSEVNTDPSMISEGNTSKPGQAVQKIADRLAATSPSPVDPTTGSPKLQFLTHDTALKAGSGLTVGKPAALLSENTGTTLSATSPSTTSDCRSNFARSYDNTAYSYSVNNYYGGTDILSFNDRFNQIYPGISVNTSFDDIGERRDGAWQQPGMHAYVSTDSGNRADQVQTYFLANADTIARNVLGTTMPADRIQSLRDFIHGEIKQHHRGNQETISEVLHLLATQDNQTSTQLNNIWHKVLGRAINSNELSDAISQISVGHATLQTELWTVAHSQEAASHLRETISAVQNRSVNPGDETWVRGQQDSMGHGEQTLLQVRENLAHWTANDGQYDQIFRDTHGRDPGSQDREYAGNMIGNGWSVQDYRWSEAHSDAVSVGITERMRSEGYFNNTAISINDDVLKLQDDLGNGRITYQRILSLIDLGAKLSSIDANAGSGSYTPSPEHSPDSYLYKDGSGRQFWVTSRYSFNDIANDAKNAPYQINIISFYNEIKSAIGHGGKFDAQRDTNTHVLFHGNVDNANYNVGIWCAASGMTETEMNFLGDQYISRTSKDAASAQATRDRDLPLWRQGYEDYANGYIHH